MEKELERFSEHIRNKEYKKILIGLKALKKYAESSDTDIMLEEQIQILKLILSNDVQIIIHRKGIVPSEMLGILLLLDDEFISYTKNTIIEYVDEVFKDMIRTRTYSINDISEVIRYIDIFENEKDEFISRFAYFPTIWNVSKNFNMIFLTEFSTKLEQVVTSHAGPIEDIYMGISHIINFEKIICRDIKCNNSPCSSTRKEVHFVDNTTIEFIDERVQINKAARKLSNNEEYLNIPAFVCDCRKKKSLTMKFSKYFQAYTLNLCKKFQTIAFNQKDFESMIIKSFINIFNEMAKIYYIIGYFDSQENMTCFCKEFDMHLVRYLKMINIVDLYEEGIVIANTLMFISQTMDDFIFKKAKIGSLEGYDLGYVSEVNKANMRQLSNIKMKIEKNFISLAINIRSNFSEIIIKFVERDLLKFNPNLMSQDVLNHILFTLFSCILLKISQNKIGVNEAEHLLGEIVEVKIGLASLNLKNSLITTIIDYLKIYLIPTSDSENFVRNFLFLSHGKFDFCQILKKIKIKSHSTDLYLTYYEILKKDQESNDVGVGIDINL